MPAKDPKGQKSNRDFTEIINQHVLQYSKERLQIGGPVLPPTVEEFQASLIEEARGFGINFPGTDDTNQDIANIKKAVEDYTPRYAEILAEPLPNNPTDEWAGWYGKTH